MAAVDDLARGKSLTMTVPVWICIFANNQFGQDFGTGLRDSPFYKAVMAAEEGTLLMVDRDASSLQRIWCGFELHLTINLRKPLVVYTSAGQVGVSVTSGRLVEAVEDFDVTQMEASQDSDRRQIINFLCGGETTEKKGLTTDQDGNFQLVNGWQKLLSDVTTAPAAPRRQDGKLEYVQEAELFELHSAKFQKLNVTVRDKVLSAANVGEGVKQTAGIKIPRIEDRGVTLGEMRAFVKKVKSWCSEEGHSWETLTINEISKTYIPTLTAGKDTCLAEMWSSGPRKPQIVLDETWHSPMSELAAALEWFAEASRLQDNAVLFFTPLCINVCNQKRDNPDWARSIRNLLQNGEGLLSVLPQTEEQIARSNRLEQLHLCFQEGKQIYLGCSHGVLACTSPFQDGIWEFGHFHAQLAQTLLQSSWSQARCANDSVRERVHQLISQSRGGYDGFEARLMRVAGGPVLRDAALRGGSEAVKVIYSIAGRQGFLINSAVLKGSLGETAVHIAAASGNLLALRALLDCRADPNAEDHIRETPMHYAAMTGMLGSIQLLLKYGAEPTAESAFAEDALFVAQQNPARFLGTHTKKATALLQAWAIASEDAKKNLPYHGGASSEELIANNTNDGDDAISVSSISTRLQL
ncbi:unnamed protein product [Polarella glacialis]|uniref:Uncharacterized protein n=1 Tax=Polarella glacialis TaxID=89957 RepID=A0A813EEG7_POLGL|nr:unnamed protein product [Polarella glacialis]